MTQPEQPLDLGAAKRRAEEALRAWPHSRARDVARDSLALIAEVERLTEDLQRIAALPRLTPQRGYDGFPEAQAIARAALREQP